MPSAGPSPKVIPRAASRTLTGHPDCFNFAFVRLQVTRSGLWDRRRAVAEASGGRCCLGAAARTRPMPLRGLCAGGTATADAHARRYFQGGMHHMHVMHVMQVLTRGGTSKMECITCI